MKSIVGKLNWLLILMHLTGMWLLSYAAWQLVMLYDTGFLLLADKSGFQNALHQLVTQNDFSPRLVYFHFWIQAAPSLGLLTALILSFSITLVRKQFWLNSLIAYLVLIGLNRFGFSTNETISNILFFPGNLFASYGPVWKVSVNGVLLLLAALFFLFKKYPDKSLLNPGISENNPQTSKADSNSEV